MPDLAAEALLRFGKRWEDTATDEIAHFLAGHNGFLAAWKNAWRNAQRPVVVRIIKREPHQKAPPPRLAHTGLPHLPTLADLADWLELRPGDLDWLANRTKPSRACIIIIRIAPARNATGGIG